MGRAFELAPGNYSLVLQEGPDPSIEVVICEAQSGDELDPLKQRSVSLHCSRLQVRGLNPVHTLTDTAHAPSGAAAR